MNNTKPKVRLISPEGEVAVVSDLNAIDLKRRGWMEKADVEAAVAAQEQANLIAEKIIAAKAAEASEKGSDDEDDEEKDSTSDPVSMTLADDARAQAFSTVDTYLGSLTAETLREVLLNKYGVKGHHLAGEESLIAKIKEQESVKD